MDNKALRLNLAATNRAVQLGDFELGSERSRAAARLLLEEQRLVSSPGLMLRVEVIANPPATGTRCTCKPPLTGQISICKCFMPLAITKGLE